MWKSVWEWSKLPSFTFFPPFENQRARAPRNLTWRQVMERQQRAMAERAADEIGRQQITCKYNSNAWSLQWEPGLVEHDKGTEGIWPWAFYVTRAPWWNIWQHLILDMLDSKLCLGGHLDLDFGHRMIGHSQTIKIVFTYWEIQYPSPIQLPFKTAPYAPRSLYKICLFCTLCAQSTKAGIFNLMGAIIPRGQPPQRSSQTLPQLAKWESRITCIWWCTD